MDQNSIKNDPVQPYLNDHYLHILHDVNIDTQEIFIENFQQDIEFWEYERCRAMKIRLNYIYTREKLWQDLSGTHKWFLIHEKIQMHFGSNKKRTNLLKNKI